MAGPAIIYVLGVTWFYVWWISGSGLVDEQGPLSVTQLTWMTVIPFIPLDLVRVALVAAVGDFGLPRRAYANEVDAPAAA